MGRSSLVGLILAGLLGLPGQSYAQGCEPIRFTTPSLGGQGQYYQRSHEWRLSVGYRRLHADQWFVGTQPHNELAYLGSAPVIKVNTIVADFAYGITERLRLRVSVPFSTGSVSRMYPDSASHRLSATGVGDVSLMGDIWLFDPLAHRNGNIALGLGVKAPTGSNHIAGQFFTTSGPVPVVADQVIQPGDGGWGIILEMQGFRQLFDRAFGYVSGSYMFAPRANTDVMSSTGSQPSSGRFWSVPDIYSARLGVAYSLMPRAGLSVSVGGRVDGDPVRDAIGGGDSATRRPGYVFYLDPGLALTRGRDNITLSVPIRLQAMRQRSVLELSGAAPGGGFARFLIFAGYSRRF